MLRLMLKCTAHSGVHALIEFFLLSFSISLLYYYLKGAFYLFHWIILFLFVHYNLLFLLTTQIFVAMAQIIEEIVIDFLWSASSEHKT